ncbi:hypothetical protein GOZ89_00450 [Agrobacterium vitis]|uniref:Uncharacterized protein n=1 Tax=Agrobacterium vitis TaxID=373 RepID=A0A1S2DMP8_AGRVI|nr:hypothetical protein [Agrobacterium vitis]MCE6075617.1 hypothetical protein [Agrobacterium vitis]MCM2468095.1 hypothetical protein [Agrobacterium vitis]MUO70441.1 hypothetical protein [Agrobacterium vitis]MUO85385.1 hypothetical protein [Agrobacterium vitis]MUZ71701.1 hypothetical protein [Agrobacterium vitis]
MTSDWVDWFPIVFFPAKIIVLGTAMFFAIKWHHDQDKAEKKKNETSEADALAEKNGDASRESLSGSD